MTEHDPRSEETIFSTALHCASAERAPYLDEACAGRPALRQRIEELLKAQPQLGEFMENAADIGTPGVPEAIRLTVPAEERPGTRIGRYKLLQKIGEGGCGVVYMAEQEEPVKRRVALKVIKLGMDTKSVIARFEAERQALAMMDHPNIAKVLDGGATETGRPYFVMELVRGTKITEFCDQHRLSTRERLDLFIQVCQAVQHAHQKGIIHRDLKPSNILVTIHSPGAPAVPVIIDFGIAKATQGRLTDQTLFTAFEQFLGTPAYMSPEQTLMTVLDVDTRSDIYSLGVLLYELLTGRTPFDPKELLAAGVEEMRRTIREKEPLRPSTRLSTLLAAEQASAATYRDTEPPKLIHLIRGDLDWIVMKAIEKDRARRYETASGLALDVQRHLQNEPVLARPPSKLYEFQKTMRRHKAGFAATAAIIAALAAGVGVSTWQAQRARQAQHRAEQNLYVADMRSAQQALAEGNSDGTRRLLAHYIPVAGVPDHRGWEWRYLAQASRSEESGRLLGHDRWVRDLCFLEAGQLLSIGYDRRIIWWDWAQRSATYTLTNAVPAWRHAVSPDRRTVAMVGPFFAETNVYLLDTKTHTMRQVPFRFSRSHLTVGFSTTGALTIASRGQVSLWDGTQMRRLVSFSEDKGEPDEIQFAPDGRRLAVATRDGRIDVWDVSNGSRLLSWQAHEPDPRGVFTSLLFSPDGRWLVSSGSQTDRKVCVWDSETAQLVTLLEGHRHVASRAGAIGMAFSPDGRWLATAGADQTVRVWDTKSWTTEKVFLGHSLYVQAVAWAPDGHHLVSANGKGELLLWDWPARGVTLDPMLFTNRCNFTYLSPSGDMLLRTFFSEDDPGFSEIWDPGTLQRTGWFRNPPLPFSAAVVVPGGRIATGETNGIIRLWERGREPELLELATAQAGPGPVLKLQCSANGRVLVSRSHGKVHVWNLPTLRPSAVFDVRSDHALWKALAVSVDGSRVAFAFADDRLEVHDLSIGQLLGSWQTGMLGTECMAFSSDGRFLATGSVIGMGAIWSLPGPRLVGALEGNAVSVAVLAFSPDGSRLAVGLWDGTVKVHDVRTAVEVAAFHKHSGRIEALVFSPDGTDLISGSSDALCLWRAPQMRDLEDTVAQLKSVRRAPNQ